MSAYKKYLDSKICCNSNSFVSCRQDFHAIIVTQTVVFPVDRISMPSFKQKHFFPDDRISMPSLELNQSLFTLAGFACPHGNPNKFVSCWHDFRAFIATQTIFVPGDKISMPSLELKQILFLLLTRFQCLDGNRKQY